MLFRARFNRPVARVACALALAALGVLPSSAAAFQKSIWYEPHNGVDQFPLYRQLGVTIVQQELDWGAVAPSRPANPTNPGDAAYRWPASLAQMVRQATANHMRVLLQINSSPAWANGGHPDPGWAPLRPLDYAQFVAAAAREYPQVHLWMIIGEPTRGDRFKPFQGAVPGRRLTGAQLGPPHLYARILDAAYQSLKGVSRRNLIIGGNTYTTGMDDPLQWVQNLKLPNGKPPRMDMWGHNPFSYHAPTFYGPRSPFDEVQFSDLHELAGWIKKYLKVQLPLFLSEFTVPTSQDDSEFNFWVDPNTAAQWVADAMQEARHWHQIYALGWVHVYDQPGYTSGGLLTAAGQPKPDFFSFEHG